MTSVCDVLVAVLAAANTPLVVVLNTTLTDVTHSGGSVVLQATLAPGVEPLTLSARTVRLEDRNCASA